MAITTIRQVNGDGTGTGTGASVTWATSGNPAYATAGLYWVTGDGTGDTNITTAANRGTWYAFGAQGDGDDKPSWATGPSYIEIPAGLASATGTAGLVEFLKQSDVSAITTTQWEDGIDVSFGIQFAVSGTYAAGSVPQNNNTPISINQGDQSAGGAAQSYQMRIQSRNISSVFRPGILFSFGGYTGSATSDNSFTVNGGTTTDPMACLSYNKWYLIRLRWERSTSAVANNGSCRLWINGQLIWWQANSDNYFNSTVLDLCRIMTLGSGYSTAITGMKIRYCPPITIRAVPDADCVPEWQWGDNTSTSRDLRRWYPAHFCNVSGSSPVSCGAPWTMTGTATLVTRGTYYSSGGTDCGRSRFVVAGVAGNGVSIVSGTVWTGGASDDIRDSGWTHVSFTDLFNKALGIVGGTIKDTSGNVIHTFTIDGSTNTFSVDGVSKQTGLTANRRWQVVVSLSASRTIFWLHDLSTDAKAATQLRSYTVSNTWAGTNLGVISMEGTWASPGNMEFGPVGVYSKLRFIETDSFIDAIESDAAVAVGANLHNASGHLGKYWNQGCDSTVPNGWDPCPASGGFFGYDICMNLARSGYKLSEAETYYWSSMPGTCPLHGMLIGGYVNDVTHGQTSYSAAWAQANTIADRTVRFAQMCSNSGGSCLIADTINVDRGTGLGTSFTQYSSIEPSMVSTLLEGKLRNARVPNVTFVRTASVYTDPTTAGNWSGSAVSGDGVHPAATAAPIIGSLIHTMGALNSTLTGYNSSGQLTVAQAPDSRTPANVTVLTNIVK